MCRNLSDMQEQVPGKDRIRQGTQQVQGLSLNMLVVFEDQQAGQCGFSAVRDGESGRKQAGVEARDQIISHGRSVDFFVSRYIRLRGEL